MNHLCFQKFKETLIIFFHYHCFDETVLNKINKPFKSRNIISSFIGNSFGENHNNPKKRYLYLDEICKKNCRSIFKRKFKDTYKNNYYLYKFLTC